MGSVVAVVDDDVGGLRGQRRLDCRVLGRRRAVVLGERLLGALVLGGAKSPRGRAGGPNWQTVTSAVARASARRPGDRDGEKHTTAERGHDLGRDVRARGASASALVTSAMRSTSPSTP
jgi:hypothetical protein